MRKLFKGLLLTAAALVVAILVLVSPIAYVETFCRGDAIPAGERAVIVADPAWQRPESRTFLTFPEWQMVYAYDDFAAVLAKGDEHDYGYLSALRDFWSSYCSLNRVAAAHGGATGETRMMIYTIGTSFNAEFLAKATYEETLGRLFAAIRGAEKTGQDRVVAGMAADYAQFLRQVPWYRYPFDQKNAELWSAPVEAPMRGWERRLAIGAEWTAKQAYARLIGQAVAATGQDELRMRSVVAGLSRDALADIAEVTVVEERPEGVVIETPRYAAFTGIVREIAAAGGRFVEIAGNDDIMASLIAGGTGATPPGEGTVLGRYRRQGREGERLLYLTKVTRLAALAAPAAGSVPVLEHVYDY